LKSGKGNSEIRKMEEEGWKRKGGRMSVGSKKARSSRSERGNENSYIFSCLVRIPES